MDSVFNTLLAEVKQSGNCSDPHCLANQDFFVVIVVSSFVCFILEGFFKI